MQRIQSGTELKDVKADINERYSSLFSVFEVIEGNLKTTIAKFQNTSQSLARTTSELQEGRANAFDYFLIHQVSKTLFKTKR